MDAQLSNNLSRGLGAVADTFNKYAQAAHEDRLQAAKESFAMMLESQRQDAEDKRSKEAESQRAADRASESALSRAQHADDMKQRDDEFQATLSDRRSNDAEMRDQGRQRLEIERTTAATAAAKASKSTGPKAPSQATLLATVKEADAALAKAQQDYQSSSGLSKSAQVAVGTTYGNRLVDAQRARAAAGLTPPTRVMADPDAPLAPVGGSAAPAAPASTAAPADPNKPLTLKQAKAIHQAGGHVIKSTINGQTVFYQAADANPGNSGSAGTSGQDAMPPNPIPVGQPPAAGLTQGASATDDSGDTDDGEDDSAQAAPPQVGLTDPNSPPLAS